MSSVGELWQAAWQHEYDAAKRDEPNTDLWRKAGRVTKDKPNGEDLKFWELEGLRQCHAYTEWLDQNPNWRVLKFDDDVLAAEWGATFQFGGVTVKGFIDAVYDTGTGELVIVDYKTGSRKPDSAMQLGLYASMIEQAYGIRPQLGAFYMTRKGEVSAPDLLDQWDKRFFDGLFADVDKGIKHGLFPPSLAMCGGCGVRPYCAAGGGELADTYDPYLGAGTVLDTAPHRSFSQVSTYTKCGRMFYLQRVAKVPEKPSVYLVAGKAVHTVFEQINRQRFS